MQLSRLASRLVDAVPIEYAIGGVTVLLDLDQHIAGADAVETSSGQKNGVAGLDRNCVNKIGDRNLYVISANINGHEIRASDFIHRLGDGPSEVPLVANMLVLPQEADVAIAEPPPEGWPAPAEQGTIAARIVELGLDLLQPIPRESENR